MEEKPKTINVFISQPMAGLTKEEILKTRDDESSIKHIEKYCYYKFGAMKINVLDSLFEYLPTPLDYLSESIRILSLADIIAFYPGWEHARGCLCEHFIASQYKIHTIYIF